MRFNVAADALRLFLDRVQARSTLTPEEQAAILALPATPRQVRAHREIVRLGEDVAHACLVADGYVARAAQLLGGARQIVSLHLAGDMVDLYSLVLPAIPTPLVALTPTTILQIPHAALRGLTLRFPGIAAAFWRECAIDGNIVGQWLINVGRKEARGRLAHLLCEMAVRSNQIGRYVHGRYPLPVTQEQLADALGLTAVHLNRTLQALRGDSLIQTAFREMIVQDWAGLVSVAEFDPNYLHLPAIPAATSRASAG